MAEGGMFGEEIAKHAVRLARYCCPGGGPPNNWLSRVSDDRSEIGEPPHINDASEAICSFVLIAVMRLLRCEAVAYLWERPLAA